MSTTSPATYRQINFIRSLLLERAAVIGFDPADIDAVVAAQTADLTTKGASQVIDRLKSIPMPRQEVTLAPERSQAIDVLRQHAGSLSVKDQRFAVSLLEQFSAKGNLTEKQWPYVLKFADELRAIAEKVDREKALAAPTAALLERLDNPRGGHVRVVVPGEVMGTVGTDDPAYVIRLNPMDPLVQRESGAPGNTRLSNLATTAATKVLEYLLSLDSTALTEAQARYGRAFKHCGRCGSPLSTNDSKARGLGPECATKGF